MANVEQAIHDYVVREFMAGRDNAALKNDEPLIDAGIIDSLSIFLLIAFIEEHFAVKVEPQDVVLDNFATINAIKELVSGKLAARSQLSA